MGRGHSPPPFFLSASELHSSFIHKADEIRQATAEASPPLFSMQTCVSNISSFCQIEDKDILSAVQSLPNKSSSCDAIPTFLLKQFISLLLPFLSHLYNTSLSTGIFPSCWKRTVITPVLKRGCTDPNSTKSYRPISNLTVVSKLFERLVAAQLRLYLSANSLLPEVQSAYRPHHSCETAILRIRRSQLRSTPLITASFLPGCALFLVSLVSPSIGLSHFYVVGQVKCLSTLASQISSL